MAQNKSFGLDFDILKRLSKDRLVRILEEAAGTKDLIIDKDLMKLMDRIADLNLLKSHGVNKIFRLERVPPPIAVDQVVYIVNPSMVNVKYLADHVHSLKLQMQLKVHLVCVPRILSSVNTILEEEGLFGIVYVHEFTPEFISLDNDLLSLEYSSFFKDAFIDGDLSGCMCIARSLFTIESLYGRFTSFLGHGKAAHAVLKSLQLIKSERQSEKKSQVSEIGQLFIFDRDVDYVTALMTQLTYEGTLDEHFGIKAGVIELPKEVTRQENPLKVALNCRDTIFDNIRNRHFVDVAAYLGKRAKQLRDRQQSMGEMTPSQMKDYVSNEFKAIQTLKKNLALHLSACEFITQNVRKDFEAQLTNEHGSVTGGVSSSDVINYILDCIARQLPSHVVLRLICLFSIARRSFSHKEYEIISSEFLASYGYHHLITFQKLKYSELLLVQYSSSEEGVSNPKLASQVLNTVSSSLGVKQKGYWINLARKFTLINDSEEKVDLRNPTRMSYIFNGIYTPAIPQIVSELLTKGIDPVAESLKLLPLPTLAVNNNTGERNSKWNGVVVVVFLGGVTYGEIAALRLLSVSLSSKIIIACTSTTTGTQLVKAAYR